MSTDLKTIAYVRTGPLGVHAMWTAEQVENADPQIVADAELRALVLREDAERALAAAPAGGAEPVAIPKGWKLVPVEPTREMMEAMPRMPALRAELLPFRDAGWSLNAITNRERWADALSAAPTAQPQPQPEPNAEDAAARICNAVAELGGRNSPEDWPEAMLVTHAELHAIVVDAMAANAKRVVTWQCETPEVKYAPPGPLQWEDGEGPAQPERLPYVSALDPALQVVAEQPEAPAERDVLLKCIEAANKNLAGHSRQIDVLTAELSDEKAVVDVLRSELQDRLQKQRAAEAELQEVRKDALRYRWLRDGHPADACAMWVALGLPQTGISCWRGYELDAFIDAAMTPESTNGRPE